MIIIYGGVDVTFITQELHRTPTEVERQRKRGGGEGECVRETEKEEVTMITSR